MRCPKCGFISFDHLEQCVKCKKNIKAVSDTLHGTVFNVAAPSFLHLDLNRDDDEEYDEITVDAPADEDDFVDDDLEVLVDDGMNDEQEEQIPLQAPVITAKSGKPEVELETSEEREIEIDLSQFEDAEEFQGVDATAEKPKKADELSLSLEWPEELNDLSDLSPPGRSTTAPKVPVEVEAAPASGDLEIEGLDFDLGLNGLESENPVGSDPTRETVLALNDIDFSETLTSTKGGIQSDAKKAGKAGGGTNMDEDLNFDLDLGGLSLHKDL